MTNVVLWVMTLRRAVRTGALVLAASAPGVAQQAPAYPARGVDLSHVIGDDPAAGATIGRVANLFVAKTGLIYVIDGADFDVKVFDPSGKFVRKFGRQGAGPGEFRRPIGISVNDTAVTVRDQSNGTVVYALDGTHLITKGPGTRLEEGTLLRHGFRLVVELPNIRPPLADVMSGRPPSSEPAYRRLLLYPRSGEPDTLASIRTDFVVFTTTGRGSLRPSGFGDAGTYAVSGDSLIAIADGYAGTVKWYAITPSGPQLRRTESLRKTGASVTDRDVAEQEKRMLASTSSYQSSGGVTTRVPGPTSGKITNPPPNWSVATRAMFSDDGALWVGAPRNILTMHERGWTRVIEHNVWTVFPTGASPYTVELSSQAPLSTVHGGSLYSVPAEQGEPTIHVYRISARPPAPTPPPPARQRFRRPTG